MEEKEEGQGAESAGPRSPAGKPRALPVLRAESGVQVPGAKGRIWAPGDNPSAPRAGWRRLDVRPGVSSASAAGASSRWRDPPGRAGQRALGGAGGCGRLGPRGAPLGGSRATALASRGPGTLLRVPGSLVGAEGASGSAPSARVGSWTTCLLRPGAGEQGSLFFWGTRRTESCLSVSLFRENLCGPGVLPELLLLLGSLPRWGETGNSLRFRER